jgi:hypothetical protein
MKTFSLRFAGGLIATMVLSWPTTPLRAGAERQVYSFVKIADNGGALASMANPTLNNGGMVVFLGYPRAGGSAILMGDGGDVTTVADNASFSRLQCAVVERKRDGRFLRKRSKFRPGVCRVRRPSRESGPSR